MGKAKFISIVAVLFYQTFVQAEGLQLLPEGVWSPMYRTGAMQGLNLQYNSGGQLESLKSSRSVELNSEKLQQIAPEAEKAVDYLNKVTNNAGDLLHLGVIELDIQPSVQYEAPILAYGITDRLTVALGVPIINYKNDITISHYGSNVDQFSQKFSYDPDLAEAFDRMNAVSTEFQDEIVAAGYKPLRSVNETFVGDAIASVRYIFWENKNTAMMSSTTLNLPTGPGYNSDDLLALNLFGRTSVEQSLTVGRVINPKLTLVGDVGMVYTLPDRITARVPEDEDDLLPDATTKEEVDRQVGAQGYVSLSPQYSLNSEWTFSSGIQHTAQAADVYKGSQGTRYDLLAAETANSETSVNLGVSYSSVTRFQNKEAKLPAIVSYSYSETMAGQNTQNIQTHELWLTFFYK